MKAKVAAKWRREIKAERWRRNIEEENENQS
jgi:hypothetical protein